MCHKRGSDFLRELTHHFFCLLIKAGFFGRIKIDFHHAFSVYDDRDAELAAAGGVAGNVVFDGKHIVNALRLFCAVGESAYAALKRNMRACDLSLKGAKYEFAVFHDVKASPVQTVKAGVDEGAEIGKRRDEVGFLKNAFCLFDE